MKVPDAAAGRKGRCKECRGVTRVPRPLILEDGDCRDHHYQFAHGFLPGMSLGNPEGAGTIMGMALDSSGDLLRKGWAMVGERIPKRERLSPKGLKATFVEANDDVGVGVIQLPQALRQAEALFVAGAYIQARQGMDFRLLTLELAVNLGGGAQTMLCEWLVNDDGGLDHANFGPGPPDSREAFVEAVVNLVER
jgi:hypothetical protein